MKNKLLITGMAFVSLFALASCNGGGDDYSQLREVVLSDIEAEYKTALGLFYDANDVDNTSVLLNEVSGTDFCKIYVSKNAKDSLFVYNYDLKTIFDAHGEKTKNITISAVSATNALYDAEKTAVITETFRDTSGVKNVLDGVSFYDGIYSNSSYTKQLDVSNAYNMYLENNQSNVYVAIVYMPVYMIHSINGQDKLRDYVLVPIYHEFTTNGGVSGVREVDLGNYLDASGKLIIKTPTDNA